MNQRTLAVCLGTFIFALTLSLTNVYAHGVREGKGCGQGCELAGLYFKKTYMILENQGTLGIKQDKIDEIEKLKLDTEKMVIKQDAEIRAVSLDLETQLRAYPLDVKATDKLIDQKYDLKKAEAKSLIDALAKLKGTLTKDQYGKLKELWKAEEGSKKGICCKGGKWKRHHGFDMKKDAAGTGEEEEIQGGSGEQGND